MKHFLFALVAAVLVAQAFCGCDQGVISAGLTAAERTQILNQHNTFRTMALQGKIPGQPRAKLMPNMTWDAQLEKEALDISNTCNYMHQPVNDPRFYVGQNIAYMASTSLSSDFGWTNPQNNWFNEYKVFVYPTGSGAGHYTQIVWAKSIYLGCSATQWKTANGNYAKFFVCHYGPGGNYVGEAPYIAA